MTAAIVVVLTLCLAVLALALRVLGRAASVLERIRAVEKRFDRMGVRMCRAEEAALQERYQRVS